MNYIDTNIVIIGGGAAGFFCAANVDQETGERLILLEKSANVLSKVKVSGGGRCNVTHDCFNIKKLISFYPRGGAFLQKAFSLFSTVQTTKWFEERGVALHTEKDGRMFPVSNNSQTIIDCLSVAAKQNKVKIFMQADARKIRKEGDLFFIEMRDSQVIRCNKVVVCAGGGNKEENYEWIKNLGHTIEKPVPSLFTFNIPLNEITSLMGISVQQTKVKIAGTKLESEGPLLITHWGFSGPVILKLSAFGARLLQEKTYEYTILVNWISDLNEEKLRVQFEEIGRKESMKVILSNPLFSLPRRLWEYLVTKAAIPKTTIWAELPKKNKNILINLLVNDAYEAKGKTTFKEEFVTCGGVSLQDVNPLTMESLRCKNLFFAGEILDIDGITGGFNFQAAWTTAWIAAKAISK